MDRTRGVAIRERGVEDSPVWVKIKDKAVND